MLQKTAKYLKNSLIFLPSPLHVIEINSPHSWSILNYLWCLGLIKAQNAIHNGAAEKETHGEIFSLTRYRPQQTCMYVVFNDKIMGVNPVYVVSQLQHVQHNWLIMFYRTCTVCAVQKGIFGFLDIDKQVYKLIKTCFSYTMWSHCGWN